MRIIDRIEKIMNEKGITRYQIEKNVGIKQSTFKNWVNGTEPGVEKIVAILKYLEVSADEIFEINKSPLELTEIEKQLLYAYQKADAGTQKSVRKLLDIPENKSKSSEFQNGKAV